MQISCSNLHVFAEMKDWDHQGLSGITFGADEMDQVQGKERIKTLLADPDTPKPFCAFTPPGKDGACWDESKWNIDIYNMGVFRYRLYIINMENAIMLTGITSAIIILVSIDVKWLMLYKFGKHNLRWKGLFDE